MAVKLRLARKGAKKRPYYWIVAADGRMPRDGRYIEKLGTYNPLLPKDAENRVTLVEDRIKYWLGQGAQPTERVSVFLGKAGIIAAPEQRNNPEKAKPKAKTLQRLADKEEKRKAAEEAAAEAAAAPAEEEVPAEEAVAEAPAEETAEEKPGEESEAKEEEKAG